MRPRILRGEFVFTVFTAAAITCNAAICRLAIERFVAAIAWEEPQQRRHARHGGLGVGLAPKTLGKAEDIGRLHPRQPARGREGQPQLQRAQGGERRRRALREEMAAVERGEEGGKQLGRQRAAEEPREQRRLEPRDVLRPLLGLAPQRASASRRLAACVSGTRRLTDSSAGRP